MATIVPVVFFPGGSEQVVTITILNDDVLESEEAFSVLLFSDESSVVIPQNMTTVRIQDEDRKDPKPPSNQISSLLLSLQRWC